MERVDATPAFGGQAVVERLLSDLHSLEQPVVLVIDDLHELRSAEALQWLELFLTRLPPRAAGRAGHARGPAARVAPAAAAGRLTEIRADELRFSLEETRELLDASGVGLSDAAVALLHERTEGWAAGLRLAAISLAGHPDPERFVAEFSGSERTVAGYLLAEVLERQPPEVRDLLLRTSVLERVSGPLADALTGGTGSEAILQSLEDANAFVTSLDVGASWFRYHHLFADLLQLELRRTSPTLDRLAAPRGGTVVRRARATWSRRSATRRRRATGRTPRGCSPTTLSASCSTAATRRCARCWPPSRPTPPRRMRSWPWRSPPARLFDGVLDESARPHRRRGAAGRDSARRRPAAASTCGWPARGCGWRLSAAISTPRGRRCGLWKRSPPGRARAATTIARRR